MCISPLLPLPPPPPPAPLVDDRNKVNSNPCLDFVRPLLEEIITGVIEDTLRVALDPIFRPPERHRAKGAGGSSTKSGSSAEHGGFTRVYPASA